MFIVYFIFVAGMWKRKRKLGAEAVEAQIFVEAKAGSGKKVPLPLPLKPFISNVNDMNVVQFVVKFATKSECFIDHHLQRYIFKDLWFT